MNLTVLGNYGPYPPAGGSCSGYLLGHDDCFVLLECGSGVLSNLQYHLEVKDLSAVIISHLHSDHVSDLFVLRYAWQQEMDRDPRLQPLPIYAPGQPEEEYARIPYKNIFKPNMIDGDKKVSIGPLDISFLLTRHSVPCYAVSVKIGGKKQFVYTADTEYFPGLVAFSTGAPLLLCEANYLEKDIGQGAVNHMSAFQAGKLAWDAGVETLLLTHLPPSRDGILYLNEAGKAFPSVLLAEQGKDYFCGSRTENKNSSAEWVQLSVETDPIIISLLEGRLRAEGIPVITSGEAVGGIYGLTTGPLAEKKIMVPFDHREKAEKVLWEIEGSGSEG
ncbi:MAG TPA: MBL fold metallo-hydrolase [Firmicutes bacterium]|jgi:ribonuclease BN (tRNA processing enzyme)|nr:MBL fold metallo-hydrolase [Bacillota bacterium]